MDAVAWRALGVLTVDMVRRLLREGLVLRSVVWPGLLASGALAATLLVIVSIQGPREVGLADGVPDGVGAELEARGFAVVRVADAEAAVSSGRVDLATDGRAVHSAGASGADLVEAVLRDRAGAPWTLAIPDAAAPQAGPPADGPIQADAPARVLSLLFMLYGLVFGLGGVARDRDAGILDAELCLPVPRWITGLARWLASTFVLASFLVLSAVMLGSVLPMGSVAGVILHGVGAIAAAVAIGMAVVGQAGLRQGFAGPFGVAMTVMTGLASVGWRFDVPWLPVASLFSAANGAPALVVGLLAGPIGSVIYARRSGGVA